MSNPDSKAAQGAEIERLCADYDGPIIRSRVTSGFRWFARNAGRGGWYRAWRLRSPVGGAGRRCCRGGAALTIRSARAEKKAGDGVAAISEANL
jgi:hypothetical protein